MSLKKSSPRFPYVDNAHEPSRQRKKKPKGQGYKAAKDGQARPDRAEPVSRKVRAILCLVVLGSRPQGPFEDEQTQNEKHEQRCKAQGSDKSSRPSQVRKMPIVSGTPKCLTAP